MSQPTVAAYFNTRKRVAADELGVAARTKVLVLEQPSSSLSSGEAVARELNFGPWSNRVAFANTKNFLSKNAVVDEVGTRVPETRRISRATRAVKRIGPVTVDEKTKEQMEQPKLVKFLKMGLLSPKKKPASPVKSNATKTPTKAVEFVAKNNNADRNVKTPTKQIIPTADKQPAARPSLSDMSMEEIKSKLSGSARLAELKTSLNKLQSGFDKLDRLEKIRLEGTKKIAPPPSPTTAARNLKQFETLEVEVPVSPQKPFTSPSKMVQRTPTKANYHSSLMSPQKGTVTPKRMAALMSPIKNASGPTPVTASPTKLPAYQRFANLAEANPSPLQLPFKYRSLAELFKCIDTVCAMFYNRKEQITFKKLKPAVQRMARKNLYESHLAQIAKLFPEAFVLSQELTKNYGSATKHETYQLVVRPNVEEKKKPSKVVDECADIIRNAQNQSMNPEVLIKRFQQFNRLLLEKTRDAHQNFLLSLDPPVMIPKEKLARWHPGFELENCPDIEQADLPKPPNVERFSSAKDVLSTARNLFNCGTAMERALDRLEKKQQIDAAANELTEDASNLSSPSTSQTQLTNDPIQSALKNVPKSLLEKIRAKQAAKALDQMTRRPSQEQEAIKYGRLPEIARHLRNVFVTEKKGVLPLDVTLVKIENSYRGKLSLKELEEHLKMICQLAPFWLMLTEVRKTMYVKISKDVELTKVIGLLEKKANDSLKC